MSNFDRDRGDRFGGGNDRGGFGGGRGGRDSGRREGGRPEMFSVVCDECGSGCQVPFKPTGDRPVYCSDCFRDMDGGGREDRNDRNDRSRGRDDRGRTGGGRDEFGERKMFAATCDQCGNSCELPFKPTSDKPVFCSDCFVREEKPKRGGADYKADFEALNSKLDLIIKHLGISEIKEEAIKVKTVKVAKEVYNEEIETPVKVKAVRKTTKKVAE